MKLIFPIFVLLSYFLPAQTDAIDTQYQVDDKRVRNVRNMDDDLIEFELSSGGNILKSVANFPPAKSWNYLDSTIIDIENIDTLEFWDRYLFWQKVNISETDKPIVGDVNNNGFQEIYGWFKEYAGGYSDVYVKEINSEGEFDSIFIYDSTRGAKAIYDINNDGLQELHLKRLVDDTTHNTLVSYQLFFEKPTDTSLATELSILFHPYNQNSQQDDNTYGNFDNDSHTDMVYIAPGGQRHLRIYEYNSTINNFDSVYNFYFRDNGFTSCAGFSIADFDQDGIQEIVIGSLFGDVIVFESNANNSYEIVWIDTVETYNAFIYLSTDDIDGNGKPEFWVGGSAFFNGVPKTRFTCFEATGNNQYKKIAKIDFIGLFTWYGEEVQSVDVDKDGINEIFFCLEQYVGILKFIGSPGHHKYELFYISGNDLWGQNSVLYTAGMYDFTGDERPEILIHQDLIDLGDIFYFTLLYEPNFTLDVNTGNEKSIHDDFILNQNYPNPFNPNTTITFSIPHEEYINVRVFNCLGEEITTLLNESLARGNYSISWDGKDEYGIEQSSGIYLIRFYSKSFSKTIKTVLIK